MAFELDIYEPLLPTADSRCRVLSARGVPEIMETRNRGVEVPAQGGGLFPHVAIDSREAPAGVPSVIRSLKDGGVGYPPPNARSQVCTGRRRLVCRSPDHSVPGQCFPHEMARLLSPRNDA
jgi:hypothetical protein